MNEDDPGPVPGLDRLTTSSVPPPDLEDRLVEELRRRRLISGPLHQAWLSWQPGLRRRWRFPAAIAAALAAFALGMAFGRARGGTEPAGPRFVLLLYTGSDASRLSAADEAARTAEYGAWARALVRSGTPISGEKLEDDTIAVGGAAPSDAVRGYFVVTAPDLAAARSIASRCPHVVHGGVVVVRPIAGTGARS